VEIRKIWMASQTS